MSQNNAPLDPEENPCVPMELFWPTVGILAINLVIVTVQLTMALCKLRRKVRVRNQHARRRLEKESIEVHTICDAATLVKSDAQEAEHETIWIEYIKSLDKVAVQNQTSASVVESVIVTDDESCFESFELVKSDEAFGVGLERIFDQHISAGEENLSYCTNDEVNTNSTV
jgi:hypothetical protein